MKNKILYSILLVIWMFISLLLVCSVIGLFLFVRADYNTTNFLGDRGMSSWYRIGHRLIGNILND